MIISGKDGVDLYGRKKSKVKATSAQDELKEFYEMEDERVVRLKLRQKLLRRVGMQRADWTI